MSISQLNLTSQEPQFILSEDGRRGKWSQRGSLGRYTPKPNSYPSNVFMNKTILFLAFLVLAAGFSFISCATASSPPKKKEAISGAPGGAVADVVQAKGTVKPPRLIKSVNPTYPEDALRKGIEGVVILECTTDIKGRVANVRVLRPVPGLDKAAIAAVKKWKFEPMIVNGQPQPVVFTVSVFFRLKK